MKRIWILIGSLFLGNSLGVAAPAGSKMAQEAEEITPEKDKAAAKEASSAADRWAASLKEDKPSMAMEAAEEAVPHKPGSAEHTQHAEPAKSAPQAAQPVPSPKPAPAREPASIPAKPAAPAAVSPLSPVMPKVRVNEMKGRLVSKSYDPRVIRLLVDGGFNVEFTYDPKTTLINGGKAIRIDDLDYNDELIVRYVGKELYAVEIDRVSQAPRPE